MALFLPQITLLIGRGSIGVSRVMRHPPATGFQIALLFEKVLP